MPTRPRVTTISFRLRWSFEAEKSLIRDANPEIWDSGHPLLDIFSKGWLDCEKVAGSVHSGCILLVGRQCRPVAAQRNLAHGRHVEHFVDDWLQLLIAAVETELFALLHRIEQRIVKGLDHGGRLGGIGARFVVGQHRDGAKSQRAEQPTGNHHHRS